MNKLLSILKSTKIDFTKTVVIFQGGSGGIDYFELKPKDFIRYAKEDFKLGSKKGLVNSITNAKRAIDCQIDTVLRYFGVDFDKIPKESEELIKQSDLSKSDLPHKLKLIQTLKFAPSGLTSKARTLRNRLEHYYHVPNEKEIEESIEIAELFIMSCEGKTKMVDDDFVLSSTDYSYKTSHADIPTYLIDKQSNQIRIRFDYKEKRIEIEPMIDKVNRRRIYFDQSNAEFYFIIRLINSLDDELDFIESLKMLLEYIEHPLPSKLIKIADWR